MSKKPVKGKLLAEVNPELAKEWHPTKNDSLTPEDISYGSGKKVWWKCPKGIDHEWDARIDSRHRGKGCPFCANFRLSITNNLSSLYPKIAEEWHPTKNGGLVPQRVIAGGLSVYWFKCKVAKDHIWQSRLNDRIRGQGCPFCAGISVAKSNCLQFVYPKLAKEWHPTKNDSLTPKDITYGSNKKVWWSCLKGKDHVWAAQVNSRVAGKGCPYCYLTPQSKQELEILFELKQFFTINPQGYRTTVNGRQWSIDIYIEELHLGIEFDGSRWHKNKEELDKKKTRLLNEAGYKIIRIREKPLKPITPIDLVSEIPFNAKKITDEVLKRIILEYELDAKTISQLSNYFRKRKTQNITALEKYIDFVLNEKARRKNQKTRNNKT